MMTVTEAMMLRHSTRAFLDRPVERELVEEILTLAARAPSGGNLQPWFVDAVAGADLQALKAKVAEAREGRWAGEPTEFAVYPPNLPDPYRSRRHRSGEDLYGALGIAREERSARLAQFARNYEFFGAPVGLFFSIERIFDRPQWAHLGMFMEAIMLLAQERGLATCPQEAWAAVHGPVAEFLQFPAERMLYCGMALGYADTTHPINRYRTGRETAQSFANFRGF